MIRKIQITILVAFCLLAVFPKDAKAQFSGFNPADLIDYASFLGLVVPYPDSVEAGLFSASILAIPLKISKDRQIDSGPPNIAESSILSSTMSDSRLYPDSDNEEFADFQAYIKKLSTTSIAFGPLSWKLQSWSVLGNEGKSVNSIVGESYINSDTIENYIEYAHSDHTSLVLAHRKKMTLGQSIGINPADVFATGRQANQNLPSFRKHLETPGIELAIVAEHHDDNYGDFMFATTPPDSDIDDHIGQYYASYGTLLGTQSVDLRFFGFYDVDPTAGISISAPAPQGFTLYTDFAVRHGKGIQRVLPKSNSGEIKLDTEEDKQIITDLTLGVNVALGPNFLISAEYSHLSNGYDESEWENFDAALTEANPEESEDVNHSLLYSLREIYESDYLRRDYGLLRLQHKDLFGTGIETDVSAFMGLNDLSGILNMKLGRDFGKFYRMEAYASHTIGQESDEFSLGRVGTNAGASFIVKY